MTTPAPGISQTLMIASRVLQQQSQGGLLPPVAAGQPFWADGADVPNLIASGEAAIAPGGTIAPPPEPPFTANGIPGDVER